jgi:UDP:flavonoid glycosyltransferase YjiC (YdhE family)
MRLLLTGHPMYSHLVPALVPLARRAMAAGHEVAVATAPSMADLLAGLGVPHLPLPGVASHEELRTSPELARRYNLPERLTAPGSLRILPGLPAQTSRAFAGPIAALFAEELLDAAGHFRPDIIVHESFEYGGYLAAEVLGIPHVTLKAGIYHFEELLVVADVLDTQRVRLGLPSTADPWHPHRHLTAALMPRDWYPPRLRSPTLRFYRNPDDDAPPAGSPTGPTVLASLGSLVLSLPGVPDLLPVIAEALGTLPRRCVLALGGEGQLADRLSTVPANVTVLPFVDQRAMLASCDLFVTHAGSSGVIEAITAGVPMVALPVVADQPGNARRLAELGLGEWLDIDSLTAADLAASCSRVLADPGYTRRVAALRDQLNAAPDLDGLIEDLCALAGEADLAARPGQAGKTP